MIILQAKYAYDRNVHVCKILVGWYKNVLTACLSLEQSFAIVYKFLVYIQYVKF